MFCKKESTIHTISIFQFKSLKKDQEKKDEQNCVHNQKIELKGLFLNNFSRVA